MAKLCRIASRANQPASSAKRAGGEKEKLFLIAIEREVSMMTDDADHRVRLGHLGADARVDRLADRRLLTERELRGFVVDHHEFRVRIVVLRLGENASSEELHAHRVEVAWRREHRATLAKARRVVHRVLRAPTTARVVAVKWDRVGGGHHTDTR